VDGVVEIWSRTTKEFVNESKMPSHSSVPSLSMALRVALAKAAIST
jgi:hypothetical protein